MKTIAIIGSFKQHNEEIQALCRTLRESGITVTTPQGESIINTGHEFVRYGTDDPALSDDAVQSLALHRILRADLVYAVLPNGYIGRTTCYEVGRVVQARRPIYFSQRPKDLPIRVPDQFILDRATLLNRLIDPTWGPAWLFNEGTDSTSILEQELMAGKLSDA
ncbi:hypothetical protein [Burkholderia gladioli]|uniref:hypothetical protein n=1 Tax=Burkholderia gladioli TaxID=28095 RepID=UPI002FE21EEB